MLSLHRPFPGSLLHAKWESPVNRPCARMTNAAVRRISETVFTYWYSQWRSTSLLARVKLMMPAFSLPLLPYSVCATITDVLAALSVLSQAVTDFRKCSSTENLKKALILQVHKAWLRLFTRSHLRYTHTQHHTTPHTGSVLQLYRVCG